MTNDLVLVNDGTIAPSLYATAKKTLEYQKQSKSPNTLKAYANDWAHFCAWCSMNNLLPLPALPQTVALYITELADQQKLSTIGRRLVAIKHYHKKAGEPSPTDMQFVEEVWAGIRRDPDHKADPYHKKAAVKDYLIQMVNALPSQKAYSDLTVLRDKTILLIGFAGAFRRSELVSLDMEDIEFKPEGVTVAVRRSKTDQEGKGMIKAVPYGLNGHCPVKALQAWLEAANITSGPLFRPLNRHGHVLPERAVPRNGKMVTFSERLSSQSVALIVKRAARAAGLDGDFSAHSLRSGLATSAAMVGAEERHIMRQTGHKSLEMVRHYIQEGERFKDNVLTKIGL